MILSKSNYLSYLKHPAWLWLEKHDKDKIPEVDDNIKTILEAGNIFETYAEKLFPDGVALGYKTNDEFDYQKYEDLPAVTEKAIKEKTEIIFQGRLEVDDTTCIFDVLKLNEDGTYDLYEIKATTKVKGVHEHDLAFQTSVLEKFGLEINNIFVIHVNNKYVRLGEIDNEEITDTTEVTSAVRNIMPETVINIEKAKAVMALKEMPDPSPRYVGPSALGEWLNIYKNLTPNLDRYSIYNLCSPGASRIGQLEDMGVQVIKDIPSEINLTVKQHHQVHAIKKGERLINTEEVQEFLKTLQWPLYFFDYETISGVIPAYDGVRPYQQIPFQYSLHKLDSPTAKLEHMEYLHNENSMPTEPLVKQLIEDIGTHGSVIVWNQSFEKMCNTDMGKILPKHKEFLSNLNDRIVDLMIPFSQGWYVDKDFFGSASVKAVLPVLVPSLSYDDLTISGGTLAARTWMETFIQDKNLDKIDEIMEDLKKYCGLDTLAMVEIWKILGEV